jgi:hypothetical protein
MASSISATNATCAEATALVGQVAAGHNFYSGPRSFSMGGFACTVSADPEAVLPSGLYSCSNGSKSVTWVKS